MSGALKTEHDSPQASPGFMLWRVTNAWQRSIRIALTPFELTHVQFVLLAVLASTDREISVTQRDLAERAATDPMMTSQVLRTLETKGFVKRLRHPEDGRARTLAITAEGDAVVNQANAAVEAADRRFFSALGSGVRTFTDALRALSVDDASSVR